MPGETAFVRNLTTALGENIEAVLTDGSRTEINEGDRSYSYFFTGDTGNEEYYVGVLHRNGSETMRIGEEGRYNDGLPSGATWLQHRDSTVQKLYLPSLKSHVMIAGEKYRFAGTFFAGKVQMARRLITGI